MKPLSEYYCDYKMAGGLKNKCKKCESKKNNAWNKKARQEALIKRRTYE